MAASDPLPLPPSPQLTRNLSQDYALANPLALREKEVGTVANVIGGKKFLVIGPRGDTSVYGVGMIVPSTTLTLFDDSNDVSSLQAEMIESRNPKSNYALSTHTNFKFQLLPRNRHLRLPQRR